MAEPAKSFDPDQVYDTIIAAFEPLYAIPHEFHLFCPIISKDDTESYESPDEPGDEITVEEKKKRIADSLHRKELALTTSLLLGIRKEEAGEWLPQWVNRAEACLTSCANCVQAWQKARKGFLRAISDKFNENVSIIMESKLYEFDKARIDRGLSRAQEILKKEGPMKSSKLVKKDEGAVLALYEALCCYPYLSLPENRVLFNFVFQEIQKVKRPLRLGSGVIPTMTFFLFQEDESGYRYGFAKAAWDSVAPGSLIAEQFEWAVHEHLAYEMEQVARLDAPEARIQRFWEAINTMLPSMSEDFVIHTLRGMQVQPDIYNLAFQHLSLPQTSAGLLATIIKALCALLKKSTKAFWEALHTMPAAMLAQHIWASPACRDLLARSLDPEMLVREEGRVTVPLLSYFVETLMLSLKEAQRNDVCDSILHQLLEQFRTEPTISRAGKAACTSAAFTALACVLEGLRDNTSSIAIGTALIYIATACNSVLKYKTVLVDSIGLQAGDQYNIGLSETALKVVSLALTLDAKTFAHESKAIKIGVNFLHAVDRESSALWDTFTNALHPSKTPKLANVMMRATASFGRVERFVALKHDHGVVKDAKRGEFNARFTSAARSVGRLIERLSEFGPRELESFCVDRQAMKALIGCLIHGEAPISDAAIGFIKAVTDEYTRSDALEKMVQGQPELFLRAFSEAIGWKIPDYAGDFDMFAPVPNILKWAPDLLNALCDTASGLLRSRELTGAEITAVQSWWKQQWVFAGYFFNLTRQWAMKYVERVRMEQHCREAVELVDSLMKQYGLVASALTSQSGRPGSSGRDDDRGKEKATEKATTVTMKTVLEAPCNMAQPYMQMLQLRDERLLDGFASSVVNLLRRLREHGMSLPPEPLKTVRSICKPGPDGKYVMNSNLTPQQKAELLRALGEDPADEDTGSTSGGSGASTPARQPLFGRHTPSKTLAVAKKQSTIDAWSRAGPAPGMSVPSTTSTTSTTSSSVSRLPPSVTAPAPKKKPQVLNAATIKATQASMRDARAKEAAEKERSKAAELARVKALRESYNKTVSGEGSALQSMTGVHGKSHAPVKTDLMVDSSDDEDSDEDEDVDVIEIAGLGQAGKAEAEMRRKILAKKPAGPVKKTKIERSKKDLRARITPPMERLHQAILEWDIFHEGNDPPNGFACKEVAQTYTNPVEYRETFFPLLVNEAWRSFVTAKDESTAKPFDIKIVNRASVDRFLEVTTSMPQAGPGKLLQDKDRLTDGDIVLVSTAADPMNDKTAPNCLARVFKTTKKKGVLEVTYRLTGKGQILQSLVPGADLRGLRITNMITVEREYAALESLQYYDLMNEVLAAEPSPMLTFGEERVKAFQDNYQLNRGQAMAIINAKENDGFTLVQGPPGTGKTKTIVAMVGALLTGNINNTRPAAAAVKAPGFGGNGEAPMAKKLLVCAPSNAAVDELVLRLKAGVRDTHGQEHKISVLRLGRSEAINAAVKDVTLDELVQQKIDAQLKVSGNAPSEREKIHQQAAEVKKQLAQAREALDAAHGATDGGDPVRIGGLQRKLEELRRQQQAIGARIDRDKDSGNTYARETEIRRRQFQQEILSGAHVLCATLSGAGHDMFKTLQVEFETVIIDEAAQCVELGALIPLKYGCSKCILVGDPKQLPPTVLSQSAARYGYDQSLFVRMQQNHPSKVHLLDCQYRMHPEISLFPSQTFYDGKLADGGDMAALRRQPWHAHPMLGPYRFFDVEGIQERGSRSQSLVNNMEISLAMQIFSKLLQDYASCLGSAKDGGNGAGKGGSKIGIITPYKAQLMMMRQRFLDRWGEAVYDHVEFNTTDAFQGRECEIIIFSCVRASPTGGIGFMTDIRRMNVGLTRARSSLWILGNSQALSQGPFWEKLVEDSKARGLYSHGNIVSSLRNSKAVPLPVTNTTKAITNAPDSSSSSASASSSSAVPTKVSTLVGPSMATDSAPQQVKPLPATAHFSSVYNAAAPRIIGSPKTNSDVAKSIGGLNERGEAVIVTQPHSLDRAPTIMSSMPTGPTRISDPTGSSPANNNNNNRKRPAPHNDDGYSSPAGGGSSSASKRKAGGQSYRPVQQTPRPPPPGRITDPSAMQSLGLLPPDRPPPSSSSAPSQPQPPQQPQQYRPPPQPPMRPRKKDPVNPFLPKKKQPNPNNRK